MAPRRPRTRRKFRFGREQITAITATLIGLATDLIPDKTTRAVVIALITIASTVAISYADETVGVSHIVSMIA